MIRILITRETNEPVLERENVVTHEEPTGIMGEYNRPAMKRDFAVQEVTKYHSKNVTLLEQNVQEESFNIKAVIIAINKIEGYNLPGLK